MIAAGSVWTSDELSRIGEADELEIASLRANGTLRRPRTIWVVRHRDDIYVRSVNGAKGSKAPPLMIRTVGVP